MRFARLASAAVADGGNGAAGWRSALHISLLSRATIACQKRAPITCLIYSPALHYQKNNIFLRCMALQRFALASLAPRRLAERQHRTVR
jgi:hypothetical protein